MRDSYYSLQVDKATDMHRDAHLIACLDDDKSQEELLFCESSLTNMTA